MTLVAVLVSLLVLGTAMGALARLLLPGPDPMPAWVMIGIGVASAIVGGSVATSSIGPALLAGLAIAIGLVYLYRVAHRRPAQRPAPTPPLVLHPVPTPPLPTAGIASARSRRRLTITTILAVAAVSFALDEALAAAELGDTAWPLAIALAVLPLPVWLVLVLWIDRYEPEPRLLLAATFAWGAGTAALLAGIANTAGEVIVTESFGRTAGAFYGGSISAPIFEESLKGAALFFVFATRRRDFNGVLDGIVYAAMVGLGFALSEDVLYYGRAAAEGGLPAAFTQFEGRGLLFGLMHPTFTAMTGIGLGIAATTRSRRVRRAAAAVGLLGAMALHSINNSVAGAYLPAQFFFVGTLAFFTVVAVVVHSLRHEAEVIAAAFPGDVVSVGEVRRLYSFRARAADLLGAFREGGFGAVRARNDYLRALSALAHDQDRRRREAEAASSDGASAAERGYRDRLERLSPRSPP